MSPSDIRRQLVGKRPRRPRKEHDGVTKDRLFAELVRLTHAAERAAFMLNDLGRDLRRGGLGRAQLIGASDRAYAARDVLRLGLDGPTHVGATDAANNSVPQRTSANKRHA